MLWDGADRIEFRTHVDGSIGQDRLLRVRFPADVPGGLPVYQTATAVIGRPPGSTDADVASHWFTLDNPAHQWFGVGSTARVAVRAAGGRQVMQAIGVAEVIAPDGCRAEVRELLAALAGQGVTATCSRPDGPRYGAIDLDSNLPDFRIALGRADENPFTAEVLAAADPACAKQLEERLQTAGSARIWVPAARPRAEVFAPGADVRAARRPAGADRGRRRPRQPGRRDRRGDRRSRRLGDRRGRTGRGGRAAGRPLGRAAQPGHARLRGHARTARSTSR